MTDFNGSPEDDIFTGGSANDYAVGNGGDDRLSGNRGEDVLVGNAGADILNGGDGNDFLYSGDQSPESYTPVSLDTGSEIDTLIGGNGSDRIFAGYGDNIDGGEAEVYGDYLYISFLGASEGITADFTLESQIIGGGLITGIENVSYVQGSNFDDDITMTSPFSGYADNDQVFAMGGNDRVTAGYYTGLIDGGNGDDFLDGRNSGYLNAIYGGAGKDTIYTNDNPFVLADGGDGRDTIYASANVHGGAGNDRIFMQFSGYSGHLVFGDDGDDLIVAAESGNAIAGGSGSDTLVGDIRDDHLYSAGFVFQPYEFEPGGEYIDAPTDDMGLEQDVLNGRDGNDDLAIGYGDSADGGKGDDTLRLSLGGLQNGIEFDTTRLGAGKTVVLGGGTIQHIESFLYLRGTEFNDVLTIGTQETLLEVDAGAGDDVIISNLSSVSLQGGAGDDRFISGRAGDSFDGGEGIDTIDYSRSTSAVTVDLAQGTGARGDVLVNVEAIAGSKYGDTLIGDAAANILFGSRGADELTGGEGADTFVYGSLKDSTVRSADHITDLTDEDWIDLSAIDANTTADGDQAFQIVDAFTHAAGQMTLAYVASDDITLVRMDVDGDGRADMQIVILGQHDDFTGFVP